MSATSVLRRDRALGLGDGVARVALGLQAKHMAGEGMGGGFAIAAIFICLWAPVVLLSGHVGLLVYRMETRRLLVLGSAGQACVAAALAVAGSRVLVGANVVARRVAVGGLAAATLVGVTGRGLGKFVAPFWLLFGFMIAAYFVGGVGHGLKNVWSRTLIHTRIAPERYGRAFAAWNGVRNAAELGALAIGGLVVGLIGARQTSWLADGLSALAGRGGLAVLTAWRGRMPEP